MPKRYYLLILLILTTLFFIWFSNWLIFQYQFPPGDDPAVHLGYAENILNNQWLSYPPALHITALNLHLLTKISLNKIFIALPLFLLGIMIPLLLFLIAKRLWGFKQALLVSPLFIGLLPVTAEIYAHGQSPEITAIFLTITLGLILILNKHYLSILLMLAVFFTHHLTAIPAFAAFILFSFLRQFKKFILGIGIIAIIFLLIFSLWPYYLHIFKAYPKFIFSQVENVQAVVPLTLFDNVWRATSFYMFLVILGIIIFLFHLKKKKKFLFILFWFLALVFFSRFDYGDYDFSYRLVRTALFPGLLLAANGLLVLINLFSKRIQTTIITILLLIGVSSLIVTLNKEYSPFYYERIKSADFAAIEYLKTHTSADASILMPAKSTAWWKYLSGRNFIMTLRSASSNEPHKLYWEILDGQVTEPKIIETAKVDYIYQVGPETFYEMPYENIMFDEKKLMATGLWEIVSENDRGRLFRYKYLKNK